MFPSYSLFLISIKAPNSGTLHTAVEKSMELSQDLFLYDWDMLAQKQIPFRRYVGDIKWFSWMLLYRKITGLAALKLFTHYKLHYPTVFSVGQY